MLRRKWAERDQKRPKTGPSAGVGGSDIWAQSPRFCAVSAGVGRAIKNVSIGETGGRVAKVVEIRRRGSEGMVSGSGGEIKIGG